MTSYRPALLALAAVVGMTACSDSNSPPPPENTDPVANFTSSCTDLDCGFTDLSSDPDVGDGVASWAWTFGDGGTANGQTPNHTYGVAGTFDVTLTVTDNNGGSTPVTKQVSVTPPPVAGGPSADFDFSCTSLDCTFADQSSDGAPGTIVSWDWDFGDGTAHSAAQNPPVHSYAATGLTTYRAKLTVTDNDGFTSAKSTEFTVSPAATLQCESAPGTGTFISCDLVLDANATVTVTLQSVDCTAQGNTFQITAPVAETLFTDGCYSPAPGTSFNLNGGGVFTAGTHLEAQVISGSTKQEVSPALHVTGAYPTWTLNFDDGEDATPPEPDFNDLVITVTATPSP
jgi:PKD repeat protein